VFIQAVVLQLQKYDFDVQARHEPRGRRRLRAIALAPIKDGRSAAVGHGRPIMALLRRKRRHWKRV
jgi:hypothetical protein